MSNYYIPKPCHENWNTMTPKEQGRHCEVCSKVVVDFTKKTDQEINEVMENAHGRVCGHFSVSQLHQGEQMKVFRKPSNLFNRNWKYFALTVLGFFTLGKKSEAQKTRGVIRMSGKPAQASHDANTSQTRVYGTIYSPEQQPVSGAEILLISAGKELGRTTSMVNGAYVFIIEPGKLSGKTIDLQVHHQFYESKFMNGLQVPKASNHINITLEMEMFLLGDIMEIPDPLPVTDTTQTKPICPPDTTANLPAKEKTGTLSEEPVKEEKQDETEDQGHTGSNVFVRPEDIISTIFPNPAGTYATVHCNRHTAYTIELFDEKGTLQMSRNFSGDRTDLDVSQLSQGTYFVKVRDGQENTQTMKLVKQ